MTTQRIPTRAPADVDVLIRGCDVVTLDDAGTVVSDGAIAIKDGRIIWIGSASDALEVRPADGFIDGTNHIALPGMIDAHVHTAQQLLRGKLAEMGRIAPLRNPPWKNYYVP